MTRGVAHSTDGPFDLLVDDTGQPYCQVPDCSTCAAFLTPRDGETWSEWAERLDALNAQMSLEAS